jgi:hypothetical protein
MDITQATPSRNDGPARIGIHGGEGTGKTTLAAYMPAPLIVGTENGVPRDLGFSVATLRPRTWPDVFGVIKSLTYDRHSFQSLVIDTMDWLEVLIHHYVCQRDTERETEMNPKKRKLESIEDYGYGKGYLVAEEEVRRMIELLDVLQGKRGLHVAVLMHSSIRTFKNPSGPDFDRYEPKCHARVAAVIKEWCENLMFLHFEMDASKISEDKERHKMAPDRARAKGISSGVRLCGAQLSAMYDAKNRVRMPAVMELSDPNQIVSMLLGEHLRGDVQSVGGDRQKRDSIAFHNESEPDPRGMTRVSTLPEQPAQREPEPPRSADYQSRGEQRADERANAKRGRDERTMAMDAGRVPDDRHTAITPPMGVPAHHESRAADEKRRADDAFARARGAVEERDARRAPPNALSIQQTPGHPNAPDPKTEARTWTEPKRNAPAPTADEHEAIKATKDALVDAKSISDAFYSIVKGWFDMARGEPRHIDGISGRVRIMEKTVTKALDVRGQDYRRTVVEWIDKAAGDRDKYDAIIRRVDADCAPQQQATA